MNLEAYFSTGFGRDINFSTGRFGSFVNGFLSTGGVDFLPSLGLGGGVGGGVARSISSLMGIISVWALLNCSKIFDEGGSYVSSSHSSSESKYSFLSDMSGDSGSSASISSAKAFFFRKRGNDIKLLCYKKTKN